MLLSPRAPARPEKHDFWSTSRRLELPKAAKKARRLAAGVVLDLTMCDLHLFQKLDGQLWAGFLVGPEYHR